MTGELKVASGFRLPLEAVTRTFAFLGDRGSGKTSSAVVMAEEMADAGAQFVAIDPTGAWSGIRTSADGKRPGKPVLVFGGDAGDIALEPGMGAAVAQFVVDTSQSAVLDLLLLRKGEQVALLADFFESLYHLNREALHVFVDEADRVAPQQPRERGGHAPRLLGAIEDVFKLGRRKGLGGSLITQRPQTLNKSVLEACATLVAHRMVAPRVRAAIREWVEAQGDPEHEQTMMASLATLDDGEAWWWSPQFLKAFERVNVRPKRTFDSSATPEVGQTVVRPGARAAVDVEQLRAYFAELVDRQADDDSERLKLRIAELERELEQLRGGTFASLRRERDLAVDRASRASEKLGRIAEVIDDAAVDSPAEDVPSAPARRDMSREDLRDVSAPGRGDTSPLEAADASRTTSRNGTPLKAGMKRIIIVLARYPQPLTRAELSTLAVVARGGTLSDYLSALRRAGLIDEPDGRVVLSEAGRRVVIGELSAQRTAELAPYTPDEVAALHLGKLKAGARRMLDVLMRAHPEGFTRSELSGLAGVAKGGTLSDYLSNLRSKGLIEERGRGRRIYAGPTLYLGGDR